MTAQIVSYDFGRHNDDLQTSASRIMESGSWKDQSTVMLIPAGKLVPSKAALSWMNMITPPNNKFYRMLCMNMEVGEAYSEAIKHILAHPDISQWKYLLTVEHDNIPPPDGLLQIMKAMDENPQYSCIGGLYWTKGEGGVPQIWGDVRDPIPNYRPQAPDLNGGLIECYGTGMGFNLFRLDMFKDKKLRQPWFKTIANSQEGVGTQDLYFWSDARKYGYRCAVHCGVKVGHLDYLTDITW
jgi:hypothetical protein